MAGIFVVFSILSSEKEIQKYTRLAFGISDWEECIQHRTRDRKHVTCPVEEKMSEEDT